MPHINGTATFTDSSCNYGSVTTAFFVDSAENVGTATHGNFSNVSLNRGIVENANFYTDSINLSSVCEATFYDSSINNGTIEEIALFTNTSTNSSVAISATFIGDSINKGAVTKGAYETPEQDQGTTQESVPISMPVPTFDNVLSGYIVVVLMKDFITNITEPSLTTTSYDTSYDENGDPVYNQVVVNTPGASYNNNVSTTYVYAGSSCLDAIYAFKFDDDTNLSAQSTETNVFSNVYNTIGFRQSFVQQVSTGNTAPFTQYNILSSNGSVDYDKYTEFMFDVRTNFCVASCFRSQSTVLGEIITSDSATQQAAESENGAYALTQAWPYMPANLTIRNSVSSLLQQANLNNPLPLEPLSDEVIGSGVDDVFYKTVRLFARSRTDQAGTPYIGNLSNIDDIVNGTLDFYYSQDRETFGKLPKRSLRMRAVDSVQSTFNITGACSHNAYPTFNNEAEPPGTIIQEWDGENEWIGSLKVDVVGYVIEIDVDSLVYVQTNY